MKKIILLTILQLTIVMAVPFVMTKGSPLVKADAGTNSTDTTTTTTTTTTTNSDWTPKSLPTQKFNVLDYGLKGNGTTDDTDALNALAKNTSVTNWYFPAGYTFRLEGVSVPEHVKVLWGDGTLKEVTKDIAYPPGPIFQSTAHTGYLVNGLTFVGDGVGYSQNNKTYGFITLAGFEDVHNVEVRNCIFDGKNTSSGKFGRDGVTLYGNAQKGSTKNTWIHDNVFRNIRGAGMEILHRSTIKDPDGTEEGLHNTRVNNNTFNGTGWCGVSVSQVRSTLIIEDNTFNNWRWDVEINQAKNVTFRNNSSTNNREHFVSMGGKGWHSPEYDDDQSPNINWIYGNHFNSQSSLIHIYSGNSSEIYENYIAGTIYQDGGRTGEIHHNIIVRDQLISSEISQDAVQLGKKTRADETSDYVSTNFHDNDIYIINATASRYGLRINNEADATVVAHDNNFYINNSQDCISQGSGTPSLYSNTCTKNYTGSIPTRIP